MEQSLPSVRMNQFLAQLNRKPRKITMTSVVHAASTFIGEPIKVVRKGDTGWSKLTGAAVRFNFGWIIFVRRSDSTLYQNHVILHEISHLVSEHPSCGIYSHALQLNQGIFTRSVDEVEDPIRVEREAEAGAYRLASLMLTRLSEAEEITL